MNRTASVLAGYVGVLGSLALFFYLLDRNVPDHARSVHIAKGAIAIMAVIAIFYEQYRQWTRRPIQERWKKAVAVTLGVVSFALYLNVFKLGYREWYHRHDQFHYYVGAKYFPELGYDWLYKCAAVAQDDMGTVQGPNGRYVNMKAEVNRPQRKLRDIGATNLLIKAKGDLGDGRKGILDEPHLCKDRFSPERWELFKNDIKFFRFEAGRGYWEGMQKDHGYNPPPVWTLGGYFTASLGPASVKLQQALGALDIGFMVLTFIAIYWAFGYRVFAGAAILWGCEAAGDPYYWTGGAFLRQDWLFWIVMALCLARKRWFKLAGAAMVYAGLLRIFPGLMVIGWLVVAGAFIFRNKRMHPDHVQALIGGCTAAAILLGASTYVVGGGDMKKGFGVWEAFYHHTIEVHDRTPLTNHMGLRVIVAHNPGTGKESGRMKYTRDNSMVDPFQTWKEMRLERYDKYKPVAYAFILAVFGVFVYVVRRVKHLWIAQALAVVFVILLSQLTNYYYAFMVCAAPLTRLNKKIELAICGYVVLTQFVFMRFGWNDDKYALQSVLALIFCFALLGFFWPKKATTKKAPAKPLRKATTAAA